MTANCGNLVRPARNDFRQRMFRPRARNARGTSCCLHGSPSENSPVQARTSAGIFGWAFFVSHITTRASLSGGIADGTIGQSRSDNRGTRPLIVSLTTSLPAHREGRTTHLSSKISIELVLDQRVACPFIVSNNSLCESDCSYGIGGDVGDPHELVSCGE